MKNTRELLTTQVPVFCKTKASFIKRWVKEDREKGKEEKSVSTGNEELNPLLRLRYLYLKTSELGE